MALIQVTFTSHSLMRTVPLMVVLPADKFDRDTLRPERSFPTLYLLHGVFGNCTDWVSGTRIQRWAQERDLAVVMPSGDNRFYVDQPDTADCYGRFIGEELVEITRRMFPLSRRRQDTFIGGLSMGGYGALRNGLKYHDTFGSIAALSTANVTAVLDSYREDADNFLQSKAYIQGLFGPLDQVPGSDKDLYALADGLAGKREEQPRIYMACGTDDSLLTVNRNLAQRLKRDGFDLTYREAPGAHEWDFWDSQIKQVLEWLPLGEANDGINSGNVGI